MSDLHPLRWLARWFTATHMSDQEALAAQTVAELAPMWQIIDPNRLRDTQTVWADAVAPIMKARFEQSQRLSAQYAIDQRWAMVPDAQPLPQVVQESVPFRHPRMDTVEAPAFPEKRAKVSVLITGPVRVSQNAGAPVADALAMGFKSSSGAAVRIVGDGGRGVVEKMVNLDHKSIGYARQLDSKPCYFCAMLASRGAVYKTNSFELSNKRFEGEGVEKVHDHCRCTLRPIYFRADSMDPQARSIENLWTKSTKGYRGKDAVNAFRRRYEGAITETETQTLDEIVAQHLPELQRNLETLREQGFGVDSPQVQWHQQQVARFAAALL